MISAHKRASAIENAKKATEAVRARIQALPKWKCAQCGVEAPATAHQMRKTYCSSACMSEGYKARMQGESNPNFRGAGLRACAHCGSQFKSYSKTTKYCSHECYVVKYGEANVFARDSNQDAIVEALTSADATVIDLHKIKFGCPDILVGAVGKWHLMEIKNPDTAYGKAGLTKAQRAWHSAWRAPVHIVTTVEDALDVIGMRHHA